MDVGLLDDRGQRLLARTARLQESRKVAALAQSRDGEVNSADARLPGPLAVAVAMVDTRGRALAVPGASEALDLHVHHAVGDVGHHLPEEIVMPKACFQHDRALLNEGLQGHPVDRHGQSPVASRFATRANCDSDHDRLPAGAAVDTLGKRLHAAFLSGRPTASLR